MEAAFAGKMVVPLARKIVGPVHSLDFELHMESAGRWYVIMFITDTLDPSRCSAITLWPDEVLAFRGVVSQLDLVARAHLERKPITFYLPDVSAASSLDGLSR